MLEHSSFFWFLWAIEVAFQDFIFSFLILSLYFTGISISFQSKQFFSETQTGGIFNHSGAIFESDLSRVNFSAIWLLLVSYLSLIWVHGLNITIYLKSHLNWLRRNSYVIDDYFLSLFSHLKVVFFHFQFVVKRRHKYWRASQSEEVSKKRWHLKIEMWRTQCLKPRLSWGSCHNQSCHQTHRYIYCRSYIKKLHIWEHLVSWS